MTQLRAEAHALHKFEVLGHTSGKWVNFSQKVQAQAKCARAGGKYIARKNRDKRKSVASLIRSQNCNPRTFSPLKLNIDPKS